MNGRRWQVSSIGYCPHIGVSLFKTRNSEAFVKLKQRGKLSLALRWAWKPRFLCHFFTMYPRLQCSDSFPLLSKSLNNSYRVTCAPASKQLHFQKHWKDKIFSPWISQGETRHHQQCSANPSESSKVAPLHRISEALSMRLNFLMLYVLFINNAYYLHPGKVQCIISVSYKWFT